MYGYVCVCVRARVCVYTCIRAKTRHVCVHTLARARTHTHKHTSSSIHQSTVHPSAEIYDDTS